MRILLIVFTLVSLQSFAQNVVRGPYLQTPLDDGIIVMWRSNVNTNSTVWYGTDQTNLNMTATGNSNTTEHTVQITGLQPGTKYYYAVGAASIYGGNTLNHYFVTHKPIGTQDSIRIWSTGDFGKGNQEQIDVKQSYLNWTGNTHTDVWLWLGDNVYDDGHDFEYQQKVFGLSGFSDIFSWLPFWPTPGNHDYNAVWEESTFLGIPYSNIPLEDHEGPYFDIVDVPEQAEAGGFPSELEVFYSFDVGNVHFLSLNSEVYDFLQTGNGINRMIDWIHEDLTQNNSTFTVAYFHQPPYSKGSHDSDDLYEDVMKAMREDVIPVLESYNVDIILCGHSHVFERSYLIKDHYGYSSTWDPSTMLVDGSNGNYNQGNAYVKDHFSSAKEGTVYVVCGHSGSKNDDGTMDHPIFHYGDNGSTIVGSFVMDVYRNRLDGKYLRSDGNIYDEFTIFKQNLILETPQPETICLGTSIELSSSISGGSNSIEYHWSIINETTPNVTVTPLSNISYTLTVTDTESGQVENTTFDVVVENCASLKEEHISPFMLYPNPASDEIIIESLDGQLIKLTIWSVKGEKLIEMNATDNKQKINISTLSSGEYLCSVKTDKGIFTSSFVKE
jgi:acid phosphatase type 7